MAFDITRPYGQCIGGVLNGCVQQDDKSYRRDGTEVNDKNEPVESAKQPDKQPAKNQPKKAPDAPKIEPDKEPAKESATPDAAQLSAQLTS